jgi:hypothetical protein
VIKSRKIRWAEYVARVGERRAAYGFLVGNTYGKGPLGRPRHKWENNIKINIQEVGLGKWTGLIWLRIGTGGRDL